MRPRPTQAINSVAHTEKSVLNHTSMEHGYSGREQSLNDRNGHTATGLPIRKFSILLALLTSMGGFIFGYELGQVVGE